jgi:hypothetical protein
MQAITTKYFEPTEDEGSRYQATSASGHRLIVPYSYELSFEGNHAAAARALATKLEWSGHWYGGEAEANTYVFVCDDEGPDFLIEKP